MFMVIKQSCLRKSNGRKPTFTQCDEYPPGNYLYRAFFHKSAQEKSELVTSHFAYLCVVGTGYGRAGLLAAIKQSF
ncbi:hypothetical protein A8F95_18575 [Bacillus wudalianchiensis]|uniref:Uncharacterized protein n=1 Tax=Pseudobacillus wudalianchiensis TaxID=1743143 RepID=A0A1B9B7W4_9BACI|nr:hypothetical protein A8F95_18575 [Bacillus wudalianchiensis]